MNARMTVTAEERALLEMYRDLSHWDRSFYFLILISLAWGPYTDKADKMSFGQIIQSSELPKLRGEGVASSAGKQ